HPTGYDHEVPATGEEQVPLVVDPAEVPGGGPVRMLRMLRRAGFLRRDEIFEWYLVALEVDGSDPARGQFDAVPVADAQPPQYGSARGSWFAQPLGRVDVRHAVALRGSVVLVQYRPPPLDHRVFDLHGA